MSDIKKVAEYTPEQIDWLKTNLEKPEFRTIDGKGYKPNLLQQAFQNNFDVERTVQQIAYKCRKLLGVSYPSQKTKTEKVKKSPKIKNKSNGNLTLDEMETQLLRGLEKVRALKDLKF